METLQTPQELPGLDQETENRIESEHQAYREMLFDLHRYFHQRILILLSSEKDPYFAFRAHTEIIRAWPKLVSAIAKSNNMPSSQELGEIFLNNKIRAIALQLYYETTHYLTTQLTTLLGEKLLIDPEVAVNHPELAMYLPQIQKFAERNNGLKQIEFSVDKKELMPYTEELLLQVLAGSEKRLQQLDNEREFVEVRNQQLLLSLLRGQEGEMLEGDIFLEYSPPYYDYQPGTMVRIHVFRAGPPRRFETKQLQLPHSAHDDQNFYSSLLALQSDQAEIKAIKPHKEDLEPTNALLARPLLLRGITPEQIKLNLGALNLNGENLAWIDAHDNLIKQAKEQIFADLKPLTDSVLASLNTKQLPAGFEQLALNLRTAITFAEVSVLPESVINSQNPHLSSVQIADIKRESGKLVSVAATDAGTATQTLRQELGGGLSFSYQSGSDCATSTFELRSPNQPRNASKLLTQELKFTNKDGKVAQSTLGYRTDSKEWVCTCGKAVDTCLVSKNFECSQCKAPLGKIKQIYADNSISNKGSAISSLMSDHFRPKNTSAPTNSRPTTPELGVGFKNFMGEMFSAIGRFFLPVNIQSHQSES